MTTQTTSLHTFFECIPDYRINRNKKHLLSDIIILSILAVICGAESWDSIELFGKTKLSFLKTFLKLPNVSCHTIRLTGYFPVCTQDFLKKLLSNGLIH